MAKRGGLPEFPEEGRRRVAIEAATPRVDGGRFAAKRVVGGAVMVEADVFADGHDRFVCKLLYRHEDGGCLGIRHRRQGARLNESNLKPRSVIWRE